MRQRRKTRKHLQNALHCSIYCPIGLIIDLQSSINRARNPGRVCSLQQGTAVDGSWNGRRRVTKPESGCTLDRILGHFASSIKGSINTSFEEIIPKIRTYY